MNTSDAYYIVKPNYLNHSNIIQYTISLHHYIVANFKPKYIGFHEGNLVISILPTQRRLAESNELVSMTKFKPKNKYVGDYYAQTCRVFTYKPYTSKGLKCEFAPLNYIDIDEEPDHVIYTVGFINLKHKFSCLEDLKKNDDVYYIECITPPQLHNRHALNLVLKNSVSDSESISFSYGKDIIVTVADTGVDVEHCIFEDPNNKIMYNSISKSNYVEIAHQTLRESKHDRILSYNSIHFKHKPSDDTDNKDDVEGHGSHTCASAIFGSSVKCPPTLNSPESKARLLFIDISKSSNYTDSPLTLPNSIHWLLDYSHISGSNIFSMSWGTPINNYTYIAYEIDRYVYFHPHFTVVVSAGNNGPDKGTIGSPAIAKNIISVGASSNTHESFVDYKNYPLWGNYSLDEDDINYNSVLYTYECSPSFSSRGPTFDGRCITLVAPGSFVLSAKSKGSESFPHSDMMLMRGTSMSAPIVANSLVYVTHILNRVYNIKHPTNVLKRSILITYSEPLMGKVQTTVIGTDHKVRFKYVDQNLGKDEYGFGLLKLNKFANGQFGFAEDKLDTVSRPFSLCLKASKTNPDFKVTLTYDDPPTIPGEDKLLVNNLNLQVALLSENGTMISVKYGNGKFNDSINNNERVEIQIFKDDIIRIQVGVDGFIQSLIPPYTDQHFALSWNEAFEKTSCINICNDFDLPSQCFLPHELGTYTCQSTICIPKNRSLHVEHSRRELMTSYEVKTKSYSKKPNYVWMKVFLFLLGICVTCVISMIYFTRF